VDDLDFEALNRHKWHASKSGDVGCFYAARFIKVNGCREKIYMHRVITNCPAGKEVDHLNSKSLDNRQENLEITNRAGNMAGRWNRKP